MTQPLIVERFLDADCETVFAAWTNPVLIARWFFVDPSWRAEVENELRVGGSYRLTMHTADGERHVMHGEYLEIERPRRVAFTWSSHVASNTRVVVELEPKGNGTQLRLTHYLPSSDEVRKAHEHGWMGCLGNLEHLLDSR